MSDLRFFRLFACCVPVKGAKQSIICDLQRDKYVKIPMVLYHIFTSLAKKNIDEIKAYFDHQHDEQIDQYFNQLAENEYGFFTESPENFPKLDLNYFQDINIISNAIIDFDEQSDHNLKSIIDQLSALYCEALELRFFCRPDTHFFKALLALTRDSSLRAIELVVPYEAGYDKESLFAFQILNPRIKKITVYAAPSNEIAEGVDVVLYYTTENIGSEHCCGVVSQYYFTSKTDPFVESHKFNSCLNKKIGINTRGQIKNCPSMPVSFGDIKNDAIASVVFRDDFREVWNITKDQIEICSDCEFRYICQDCRAYIKDKDNKLSKPLKCTYDPYQAEWK